MKKNIVILSVLIFSINNAFAEAVQIKMGDLAPYSGWLLTEQRVDELLRAEQKEPLYEAKIEAQKRLNDFHREEAREARSKLLGSELKGNMKGLYGFALGLLTMSLAFKVSQEIK